MTTRLQLRTSIRTLLTDSAQFRDSQVNQWIESALMDYSIRLPIREMDSISVTAGVRFYTLNTNVNESLIDVTAVEYPAGEEPRRMLTRMEERDARFLGGPYYDVNLQGQAVAGEHLELKFLILGEEPTAGQAIYVEFTRPHTKPSADTSVLTVPDHHLEVVRLGVLWRAAAALETDESISIVRKDEIINRLGLSAARLEENYWTRLKEISHVSSLSAPWRVDGHDRIY